MHFATIFKLFPEKKIISDQIRHLMKLEIDTRYTKYEFTMNLLVQNHFSNYSYTIGRKNWIRLREK